MSKNNFLFTLIKWLFYFLAASALSIAIAGFFLYNKLQDELPDIQQLQNIEYQVPLSVYSSDHVLLATFGEKKRIPVTIDEVPQQLINAFLSAEDANFHTHPGVDFKGLLRAAYSLLLTGKKKQGGSTITMQVTRNFLLTREKTYKRKIKEIILALQIEKEYSKDKILELYLNKIYLGHHSYGIAAASETYYGKKLPDLSLTQLAMLAGLPKAPSAFNPVTNPKRALQRRNYVLRRMNELAYISTTEFEEATNQPISASIHKNKLENTAPYIAEMVRKEMYDQYGEEAYTRGLKVYTTINSSLQAAAVNGLRSALHKYDQRHGYRSLPHKNKANPKTSDFSTIGDTKTAQIIEIKQDIALAQFQDNSMLKIPFKNIKWARKFKSRNYLGPKVASITDILKPNDLIKVRQLKDGTWELAQIPEAQAAFVALNSNNGAILALSGGFDFFRNKYNRVIQSKRQPGSGFKPIVYTTALENGYTPASMINDAPVVVDEPLQEGEWRPENYSKKFFGMTPLRTALRKSRNLISVRLLRNLGIEKVTETALRFGFSKEQLPNSLSLALGSGHATPLKMATVFSVFANGGFLVKPYFIDYITGNKDNIILQATPDIACPLCQPEQLNKLGYAPQIISPEISFLMNSLLRDVVQRGTATKAKALNRVDLAGKTGTTNDQIDTWFNGFSAGISATAWLGLDSAQPLGRRETGGKAALPIWVDFMRTALQGRQEQELEPPEGISKVFIDPQTGLLAQENSTQGIWEYFLTDNMPTEFVPIEPEIIQQDNEESLF